MVKLGSVPEDWGDGRAERELTKPFPLTEAWVWDDDERSSETTFGTEGVPLVEQATRLEFAGGVTARLGPRFSVFAQSGYQYAADESGPNRYRRDSVKGDIGVRYAW